MKQLSKTSRPPLRRSGDIRATRQQVSPAAQPHENTTTLQPAPVWMPRPVAPPAWVLLPLRLFLGVTFVYAGLQKLTDPQYFRPTAPGYIGRQITGFAHGSPIGGFLLHIAVPHATVFGALVAYGELAIGLATLAGFLLRLAAGAGLLLSLIFFLTASWRVYPYFYGADIVFVFGWITLVLAGPMAGGVPSLDEALAPRLYARVTAARRASLLPILTAVMGVPAAAALPTADAPHPRATGRASAARYTSRSHAAALGRRDFLGGLAAGGGGMLVLAWIWGALHPAADAASGASSGAGGAGGTAGASSGTPAAGAGGTIAQVSQIPANNATTFSISSSGDPGVLVHLSSGQFVAYDAVCTHAGCTVEYDPSSKMLLCPCHGAAFDPAQQAAVVQGPTNQPLASVPIHVDDATGAISLSS